MKTEILNKRTYNSKTIDNGDGTFTLKAHIGDIHYKDENGDFQESDFTPVDQGAYYEMAKHNYHLQVAKDFAAPLLMRYVNRYEGANHTITYEPFALAWYNPATDDVQIFRNQASVQAVYKPETNSFYYKNAFGNGIDFEITIMRSGFKKEVVIPNKPGTFPTPPSANHRMVALFKYGGTGLKVLKEKSREEWDKSSYMEAIDEGYEFQEDGNADLKSFIRPAYGEDSSEDKKRISLRVMWKQRGGQLWQIKEIPLDKMQQATFPVRFDTVTAYGPESNDAALLDRSYTGSSGTSAVWDDVHDNTGSAEADQNGAITMDIGHGHNGKYYIYRGHMVFDTSGLPTGATISNADLSLYVKSLTDFGGGTYNKLYVGQSQGPDSATLSWSDWPDIGDDGGGAGTAMNTPQLDYNGGESITGLTTSAMNTLTLNATGRAAIDDAGLTKFSLRTGHDFTDTFPNSATSNRVAIATGEDTVGDPELEITYTTSTTYYETLTASADGAASIANTNTFARTLAAAIDAAASITDVKSLYRTLTAAVDGSATIAAVKTSFQTLTASATAAVTISKQQLQGAILTAEATLAASITTVKSFKRTLTASVDATATTGRIKTLYRTLTAAVDASVSIGAVKTFYQALTASVAATATVTRGTLTRIVSMVASISAVAKLNELFYKKKYTKEDEDYKRKY